MTAPVAQRRGTRPKSAPRPGSTPGGGTFLNALFADLGRDTSGDRWHGTEGGYDNHLCRCGLCRQAKTAARRSLRQREPSVHGTASTYNNYRCRCEACKHAATAARAAWIASLQGRLAADIPHATATGYQNWGCRCDACKHAARKARTDRARRHLDPVAAT